jgi:large subunit ribosomal protein L6
MLIIGAVNLKLHKMIKRKFEEKIEIPQGIQIALDGNKVTLKGKLGEVSKIFKMPMFKLRIDGNNLVVSCERYTTYEHEKFRTIQAHIRNMIKGCQEGYTYMLKVCASHFPISVTVSGTKFIVKNLLGEKIPRQLDIKNGAKVSVNGEVVEVKGVDKDIVSQVAADIEKLTRITNRDRRVFQDGIYITSKDGEKV